MSTVQAGALPVDDVDAEVWYQRLSRFLPSTGLPWMIVSFVSLMAGGAPNVTIGPVVMFLLWVLWTYPVTAFACAGIARLLYRRGHVRSAVYTLAVPGAMGAVIVTLLLAPLAIGFVTSLLGVQL